MRLFQRVSDIIAANLNDFVDRFEDPETMLKQAIREMDDSIAQATAAAARAIAQESLLAKELAEHEGQVATWQTRAERAVAAGDDDLARRALVRKHEHAALARALRDRWSEAQEASQSVRRQVEAMKAKRAEAARKLATLSARQRAAEASRTLQRFGGAAGVESRAFARFERMRHQVEQAEAEACALFELREGARTTLEAEFQAREHDRQIEADLAAIREQVGNGSETDPARPGS